MRLNSTVPLFLSGLIFGLGLSFLLGLPYKNPPVVELDLGKIIKSYSLSVAKSTKSADLITQDFKHKFEVAIQKRSAHSIIVAKGQVLSKQVLEDDTENFIKSMGVEHNADL